MADYRGKPGGAKLEDFLRPDGSFDDDAWMTADMSERDYNRIMRERGFASNMSKGSSGFSAPAPPKRGPVVRVDALLKNAPVAKDVRSLGGEGGAQPVPEDEAALALKQMQARPKLNSSGVDVTDVQAPDVPPRSGLPKPLNYERVNGQWKNLDDPPEFTGDSSSRGVVSSLDPAKQKMPEPLPPEPGERPIATSFAGLLKQQKDQGSPEEFGTPFPDRSEEPPAQAPADSGVPKRPWTPSSYGLTFEEATQNKRILTDPEGPPEEKGVFSSLVDSVKNFGRDQKLEKLRQDGRAAIDGMNADAVEHWQPVIKRDRALKAARAQAGDAVGAMGRDERDNSMLAAHDKDANAIEHRMVNPAVVSRAQSVLKRLQSARGLDTGAGQSPEPERPQFGESFTELASKGGPASPRQPLQAAGEMMRGAAPPDTSKDEADLAAAMKKRDEREWWAQMATGMGSAANIIAGTEGPDQGAPIRAGANNALEDLKRKQAIRKNALDRQQQDDDRNFDRQGTMLERQNMLEDRGIKAEGRAKAAAYADGTSSVSVRRRAQAAAFYPEIVRKIDPKVWGQMSAEDVDTFLKEAAPAKLLGSGKSGGKGGGLSGAQFNQVRNKMPQELKDTFDALDRANEAIAKIGGWEKMKVGGLGSLTPTAMLDTDQADVRQTLAGVAQAFLSSGAGKSITAQERQILLGMSGADSEKFMTNPAVFRRGMAIIERRMQNRARQALAGVDEADQDRLLNDENGMGVSKEWIRGKADKVQPRADTVRVRNKETGKTGSMPRKNFNPDKYEMVQP